MVRVNGLDVVSLFAGVGGIDLAAERSGMTTRLACEINAPCRVVLAERFPDAVIHPDVTELTADDLRDAGAVPNRTVLTAGWPCQGNSVAGRRGGMADARSGLWSEVARLLAEFRPAWFVGENVPGLLSVNDGRDFGTVIGDMGELGYGFAWRVLDARHFGVPQRRRRVVIVGRAGDAGGAPASVLLEPEGVRWNPAPRRQTRPGATGRARGGHAVGVLGDHAHTLTASAAKLASKDGTGRGCPVIAFAWQAGGNNDASGAFAHDFSPTLPKSQTMAVAYAPEAAATLTAGISSEGVSAPGRRQEDDVNLVAYAADVITSLDTQQGGPDDNAAQGGHLVADGLIVRRLTPLECERLQGFPDNWTDVPGTSDSQRYRQMGNSVAVPVFEWVLGGIAAYHAANATEAVA